MYYFVSLCLLIVNTFTILNIILISKYLFGGNIPLSNGTLWKTGGLFFALDLLLSLTISDTYPDVTTLATFLYILVALLVLTKSHRIKTLFLSIPAILVYVQWCNILTLFEKLLGLNRFYYTYTTDSNLTITFMLSDFILFLLLYKLGQYSQKHAFRTQLTLGEGIVITILCIFLPLIHEVFDILEDHFQNVLYNIGWTLFLIALNLAIIYTIAHRKKAQYYKELSENYKEMFDSEYHYFKDYKHKQKDLVKFRHDFNSHMILIQDMMTKGEYEKAHRYFSDLTKDFAPKKTLPQNMLTGNEILDILLQARFDLIYNNQIRILCNEPLTKLKFLNEVDCCILFSNLIDNAIEANLKFSGERYITISQKQTASSLYLKITNPSHEKALMVDNQFVSQKEGEYHGIGMQNIVGIINKYKGSYVITEENHTFCIQIIFPFPFIA